MSLGTILAIILIIFLLGGFSGRFGGYGYGYGHGGVGVIGRTGPHAVRRRASETIANAGNVTAAPAPQVRAGGAVFSWQLTRRSASWQEQGGICDAGRAAQAVG